MEEHIRKSMTNPLIKQAAKLYNIPFKSIKYLGGFENFIYEFKKDDVDYILRFVHSGHHDYNLVLGEIEFIDYLDSFDASVSTVIHSINNNVVEKIMINTCDYFSVAVFVKGKGERLSSSLDSDSFWEYFGEEVAKLHSLTKNYNPVHKRYDWDNDTLYQMAETVLGSTYSSIYERLQTTIQEINTYPKHRDNFGLIHTDLHIGNMVMSNEGKLTFFDFDDSCYKHFISDIAIIIFYLVAFGGLTIEERTKRATKIMSPFIKGYNKINLLPLEEWKHLNTFFKLREVILFTAIVAGGQKTMESQWGSRFINQYYNDIISNIDFLDLGMFLNELSLDK